MKKLLPTILILVFGCTQPKTEMLTGDLYFSFFRLQNYYNQPDSAVKQFEIYFDTVTIK
jgi:hypothetical protein